MNADSVVTQLGGLATRTELLSLCTPRQIRAAIEAGNVVRLGRGVYALPGGDAATHARAALGGVISHQSAAQWWRWRLKHAPEAPVITVGRKRKLSADRRVGIDVRYADLDPSQVVDGTVTDPVTTVIACARSLPFDEALAIADSAVRSGEVTRESLLVGAATSARTGRRTAIRVAEAADGRADTA